jgi:hypothetical protein
VNVEIQKSVSDLCGDNTESEWALGKLFGFLLDGVDTKRGWLKLLRNNARESVDDVDAKFRTDWRFELDGNLFGYMDAEQKQDWKHDDWPYPKVNVAKHPLAQWKEGRFDGRPTNKLKSFERWPNTSLWVGARKDNQAVVMLLAANIFEDGKDELQPNSYGKPLPVLAVYAIPRTFHNAADVRDEVLRLFGLRQV